MRFTRRTRPGSAAAPTSLGLVAVLLIAASVACGSSPRRPVPPVPEPAAAPAPRSQPEGRVVPLPGHPEGLAFDPITARLVAGVDGGLAVLSPDGASRTTLTLGARPRHVALAENGGAVLVPLEGSHDFASFNRLNIALGTDYDYRDMWREIAFGLQPGPGIPPGDNTRGVRTSS